MDATTDRIPMVLTAIYGGLVIWLAVWVIAVVA